MKKLLLAIISTFLVSAGSAQVVRPASWSTAGNISAKEIGEKDAVDLQEMNMLLLQKIEELTKYVIDLQNQIDELKEGKEREK